MPARKPTEKDLNELRGLLEHLRGEITGDISHLENDAFSTDGERVSVDNPADIGSDSFAQEFSLELLQRDEATLSEIDDALERLETGTYGRCEGCDLWIAKERLRTVPHTRNCVDCQRLVERERWG